MSFFIAIIQIELQLNHESTIILIAKNHDVLFTQAIIDIKRKDKNESLVGK